MPPVSPPEPTPDAPAPPPAGAGSSSLPDAPSAAIPKSVVLLSVESYRADGVRPPSLLSPTRPVWSNESNPGPYRRLQLERARISRPYQQFLDTNVRIPMTASEKGFMAATNIIDLGNLATLVGSSGYYVATTPHSAFGPGWKGFGRNVGYSLVQDATGEFFGTFAIPVLTHEDPRYFRMPGAPVPKRILHALSHTIIAQHDDGTPMPNWAILGTYPATAVIANLYVPGVSTNARSTVARIGIGLASDPSDALISEFLPDVAKRLHIRVVFFQQILNNISAGPGTQ